jgi:hypothetical protein
MLEHGARIAAYVGGEYRPSGKTAFLFWRRSFLSAARRRDDTLRFPEQVRRRTVHRKPTPSNASLEFAYTTIAGWVPRPRQSSVILWQGRPPFAGGSLARHDEHENSRQGIGHHGKRLSFRARIRSGGMGADRMLRGGPRPYRHRLAQEFGGRTAFGFV